MTFFKCVLICFLAGQMSASHAANSAPDCAGTEIRRWNNCVATVSFPGGSKFRGLIVNGKMNGLGEEAFPNGDRYIGTYVDDIPSGPGIHLLANGSRYVGEFNGGNYDGKGIMINPQGVVEKDGIWSDDKFVRPQATGIDPKTDYTAQMDQLGRLPASAGTPSGDPGALPQCRGKVQEWIRCFVRSDQTGWPKYEGGIQEGRKHGKGTVYFVNGDIVTGTFNNRELEGMGGYFYVSGSRSVGNFKNGKRHGPGVFIDGNDGTRKDGLWADDEFVKSQPTGINADVPRPENLKDAHGRTIDYANAIWLFENIAYIGTATRAGRDLSVLLRKIEQQHYAVKVHRGNGAAALAARNVALIKKHLDLEIQTMMDEHRNVDEFVALWNRMPAGFRTSFGQPEKGVLHPDIQNPIDRPDVWVVVGTKGDILRVGGTNYDTSRIDPMDLYPRTR